MLGHRCESGQRCQRIQGAAQKLPGPDAGKAGGLDAPRIVAIRLISVVCVPAPGPCQIIVLIFTESSVSIIFKRALAAGCGLGQEVGLVVEGRDQTVDALALQIAANSPLS